VGASRKTVKNYLKRKSLKLKYRTTAETLSADGPVGGALLELLRG